MPELAQIGVGVAHVFIRHTSASLTLNENASPDVLRDFATWFDRRGARRRPLLLAHARGPRRHARAHQGGPARLVADDPRRRRPAGARHLAGHLPLRAPRLGRPALADADLWGDEREVRPRCMRTYVRALGQPEGREEEAHQLPGLPRSRYPPLRRPRGARHPLLRGPREVGAQQGAGGVADAVPLDDQPVSRLQHACVYCQEGSTPILMADGETKPLAESLVVGDADLRHRARRRVVDDSPSRKCSPIGRRSSRRTE